MINRRVINLGLITHQAQVELVIRSHREILLVDITNTSQYACILGTPWLTCHDPIICWSQKKVLFDSPYCCDNCLDQQILRNSSYKLVCKEGKGLGTLSECTRITRHSWDLEDASGASGRRPYYRLKGKRGGGWSKIQQPP